MAQGLYVTFNKDCVECLPAEEDPTEERYLVTGTIGGCNPLYDLCSSIKLNGVLLDKGCDLDCPPEDPYSSTFWVPCESLESPASSFGLDVDASNGPISPLGVWVYRFWQENPPGTEIDSASASFLVAETCEVEFVPEPGTLMLLGSGLAGLAGYATLRWRTRE